MTAESNSQAFKVRVPTGVRIALVFLRLFWLMMIAVLVAGVFLCGTSLFLIVRHPEDQGLPAIFLSLGIISAFMGLLATTAGCEWMIQFLDARYSPGKGKIPGHPGRMISLPVLQALAIYSTAAIVCWWIEVLVASGDSSWIWLGFWGLIWVGSVCAWRFLRHRAPFWVRAY